MFAFKEVQAFPDMTDDLRVLSPNSGAVLNRRPTAKF
jgi:hypothetical protein